MDIYNFISPPLAADYCRRINHSFSPLEMVLLVFQSEKSVKEKHQAYKEIIAGYDDVLISLYDKEQYLHRCLREMIAYEDEKISEFLLPKENAFYQIELCKRYLPKEVRLPRGKTRGLYSTVQKAKEGFYYLVKLYNLQIEDVKEFSITKLYLDSNDGERCYYNSKLEMLGIESFDLNYYHQLFLQFDTVPLPVSRLMCLSEKSFKDAVFTSMVEERRGITDGNLNDFRNRFYNRPESIDFDLLWQISTLELNNPTSLFDLSQFPCLERLVISIDKHNGNFYVLNEIIEYVKQGGVGRIKKIVIKPESESLED